MQGGRSYCGPAFGGGRLLEPTPQLNHGQPNVPRHSRVTDACDAVGCRGNADSDCLLACLLARVFPVLCLCLPPPLSPSSFLHRAAERRRATTCSRSDGTHVPQLHARPPAARMSPSCTHIPCCAHVVTTCSRSDRGERDSDRGERESDRGEREQNRARVATCSRSDGMERGEREDMHDRVGEREGEDKHDGGEERGGQTARQGDFIWAAA